MTINLSNILPINIVGVVSGTLASGTPTSVYSLASIQDVVIVSSDPIPVNLSAGAAPVTTFTYGGTDKTGDGYFTSWNTLEWAVPLDGSVIAVSLYTNVSAQSSPGNVNVLARVGPAGGPFRDTVSGVLSINGTGLYTLAASNPAGTWPVAAGEVVRVFADFDTFAGTLGGVQATAVIQLSLT